MESKKENPSKGEKVEVNESYLDSYFMLTMTVESKFRQWLFPFYYDPNQTAYTKTKREGKEGTVVSQADRKMENALHSYRKVEYSGSGSEEISISKFYAKLVTQSNDYTLICNVKPKQELEDTTFFINVSSRNIRAGEVFRKQTQLNNYARGFPLTEEGWQKAKDAILEYEVLDNISNNWKNRPDI